MELNTIKCMDFLDELNIEKEKQRLLQKYGCNTISEVREKLERILREQAVKLKT